MLKRIISVGMLGILGIVFDQWSHLAAIFLMCSAANACWYDSPNDRGEKR